VERRRCSIGARLLGYKPPTKTEGGLTTGRSVALWRYRSDARTLVKARKSLLRIAARRALELRGYKVTDISGPGIAMGGRLHAIRGKQEFTVAVRTATDRELGLIRDDHGKWKTIPAMDKVVVAAPAIKEPEMVEVFGFDSEEILEAFDHELARLKKRSPGLSPKAPVFLALDGKRGQGDPAHPLRTKADWTKTVPLPQKSDLVGVSSATYVDRVRAEYAQLHGVTLDEVQVEFRIIRPAPKPPRRG
jgi:hypothetical protein